MVAPTERDVLDAVGRLSRAIAGRSARVGVIGLGYVGLPLVELFAAGGFPVLGLDVETRTLEHEQAKQGRVIAALRCRQVEAMARLREVVAPFDGEVVAVLKAPGEPINVNDQVIRLVDAGRLRVTGRLDISPAEAPPRP